MICNETVFHVLVLTFALDHFIPHSLVPVQNHYFFTTNLTEQNHAPMVIKYLTTKHNFYDKKYVILTFSTEYT